MSTILVVDDDHSVLRLVTQVLTRSGYRVLPAPGPEQALQLFAEHHSEIRLVISDVVMPKLSGPDLIDKLHAIRPGVPVLYISGFTNTDLVRTRILDCGYLLLGKPFTMAALLARTEEILGGGSRSAPASG